MIEHGDCLTCSKIATCTETSKERVIFGYTCPLFDPVPEPIFIARMSMIDKFGESTAIEAMLDKQTGDIDEP